MNDTEALRALHARGAHLALMQPDKRPVHKGWLDWPAALDAVLRHAGAGGLIGLKPQSCGLVVVDVDRGDSETVIAEVGAPLARVASRTPGRAHLYYKAPPEPVGNWGWSIGDAGGELRGAKGAVVLWDPPAVAAVHANGAAPLDVAKLRKRRTTRGAADVRTAPQGERNNVLFAQTKDRMRRDAIRAGLPPAEVGRTIASAEASLLEEFGEYTPRRRDPIAEAEHQLEMAHRIETGGVYLYSAGLKNLFTGGLIPGELLITASRPGGAKTTIWLVEMVEQLREGGAVLFACLDSSPAMCYARLVAAHESRRWGEYFSDEGRARRATDYRGFARTYGERFAMLDSTWTLGALRCELLDWRAEVGDTRALVGGITETGV